MNATMYIGREAFVPAETREQAKALFARSVERVEVETHSFCNRRCDYCPNSSGDRLGENKRIPEDIWRLLLANLREIDFAGSVILTSYNEPLADPMILQRIREVREHLPRAGIGIFTNGDYLRAGSFPDLATAGLNYLHISIHTSPGEKFNKIVALNQIAKLVKRIDAAVQFHSLRKNELVAATVPHDKMAIEIRAVNYWKRGQDRGGLLDGFPSQPARTLPCHYPFAHFHMGFQGNVVPCCNVRSDSEAHKPYRYGNLRDFGSIFEAYAGRIAAAWRRHLISFEPKDDPCRTCSVGFMTMVPKELKKMRAAWEQHVRDRAVE